jgi:hypothetical protein
VRRWREKDYERHRAGEQVQKKRGEERSRTYIPKRPLKRRERTTKNIIIIIIIIIIIVRQS